jgi:hypothetical protein
MMQSKTFSLIEATTNTIAGLLVSFCLQLVIYPIMGIPVSLGEKVVITFAFTIVSILRGYVLRRIFNRIRR